MHFMHREQIIHNYPLLSILTFYILYILTTIMLSDHSVVLIFSPIDRTTGIHPLLAGLKGSY